MTVHTLLSPFACACRQALLSLCFFLEWLVALLPLWALGLSATLPRSLPFLCRPSVHLLLPGDSGPERHALPHSLLPAVRSQLRLLLPGGLWA